MKRFLILALAAIAALSVVATDSVEAARLGGGRSLGAQRQATPPPANTPNVAPSSPVAPAQALPPKAAPAASGASRWLGPLAGLAAGIGLAALLSHFGLSEGFASILMLALLVFAGIFLIRMFLARRAVAPAPMQYAGAGAAPGGSAAQFPQATPDNMNRFEPAFGGNAASMEAPTTGKFPPGFDPVPFVQQATLQFKKLQAAWLFLLCLLTTSPQ